MWVLSHINEPDTYLEIGAQDPILINNTYALESRGWRGASIDIDPSYAQSWHQIRTNPLLIADATTIDWSQILSTMDWAQSKLIGYVSFDVDEHARAAFDIFPWREYRFKTMTIEHDAYRFGNEFKMHERRVLSELGYVLKKADVQYNSVEFEDWWVCAELAAVPCDWKRMEAEIQPVISSAQTASNYKLELIL